MAQVVTRQIARKDSRVVIRSQAKVVASLFGRPEDSGETGEYFKAMRAYESRALEDPFLQVYTAGSATGSFAAIAPDYNPSAVIKLPNECATLRECIDAKVTNICSFGYRLEYIGEKDKKETPAAMREKERIENLLEQPNGEYTVTELRSRLRRDMETFGYGFLEIGRDPNGQVIFINHVPAHTLRMTAKSGDLVPVTSYLKRDGKLLKITSHRRFRRFVQQVANRIIYFKEFGDPRKIDPSTGQENVGLAIDQCATEIFHFTQYSAGSVYGLPCYLSNLPAIMGTRESELTNLQFFKDNAIPAMAILVSGGALTDATVSNLENHFTAARGRASINRLIVLEAAADDTAAAPDGQVAPPKLDLKPLANDRQKDGLFQEYERENEKKIRASFRLPPLFVGRCHSADTEYLTDHGWKTFDKVGDDAKLAVMSKEGFLQWEYPLGRHVYDYSGELVHIRSRLTDALVTPNHNMLWRPWRSAEQAPCSMRRTQAAEMAAYSGAANSRMELPVSLSSVSHFAADTFLIPGAERVGAWAPDRPTKNKARDLARYAASRSRASDLRVTMADWCQFLGYYLSEGSITDTRGPVTLSQNPGSTADAMVACFRRMGFKVGIQLDGRGCSNIWVSDVRLYDWISAHVGRGSAHKRLPEFLRTYATPRQCLVFLSAYCDGDGSVDPRGGVMSFAATTVSRGLSDDLQELGLRCGYAVTIREFQPEETNWSRKFIMHFRRRSYVTVTPEQMTPEAYDGKVACFTTPSGTLITRRGGRVLISGNSDDYTHATADASMVMADAQVFGPERNKEDDIWNANFLTIDGLPNEYWRLRTNPPRLVSAEAILTALDTMDDLGAVTPNIAIGIANELFDLALTPIEAEWGNYPFALVKQLALNGTLDGLQEIMLKISDPLHPDSPENPKNKVPDDQHNGDATGKPDETKTNPKPKPAEAGPGNKQTSKEDDHREREARKKVAERLAFQFRSVAERGNDISHSMKRSRIRTRPIA